MQEGAAAKIDAGTRKALGLSEAKARPKAATACQWGLDSPLRIQDFAVNREFRPPACNATLPTFSLSPLA